jgi:TatD DNase family protein
MILIDTHTHLYEDVFTEDLDLVIERAKQNGINKMFIPNVDETTIKPMLSLCEKYDCCIPMMGLHPTSVKADFKNSLSIIKEELFKTPNKFCAVGEIGIDLYWDKEFLEEQIIAFEEQINWSLDLNKPFIVHARKSFDEIYRSLKTINKKQYKGIFHCFGGDLRQAKTVIEMGFKIGIGGVLSFKNAKLSDIVRDIDIKDIVLETDSPYLAPVPYRGKRNESAYILNIANLIAEIKNIPLKQVAEITTATALNIFENEN